MELTRRSKSTEIYRSVPKGPTIILKPKDKGCAVHHDSRDLLCANCQKLQKEVNVIQRSLDNINRHLTSQQESIAREFEERIRHVYDDIIGDINSVRIRVNSIGDTFASDSKYKTWIPLTSFRKDVLRHKYEIKQPTKLTASKSVDFVDAKDYKLRENSTRYVPIHSRFSQSVGRLCISTSSINSVSSTRSHVPGYGCCFNGDGKTVPYRSYRMWYSLHRTPYQSCGSSRSGSRSALDDVTDGDGQCTPMCGKVTDDWRVKVAPHMWEGWPIPGLDMADVDTLKERVSRIAEMKQEVIVVHNEYRQRHGAPDLVLNIGLAKDAQGWAEHLAMQGYAQYSNFPDRGENVLVVDIEHELTGRQIVETWYREGKHYNYSKPRWQRGTCNFTQMIWRSSQQLGIGIAKFPYHNTYAVVVQYEPAGNFNTPYQYRNNVHAHVGTEPEDNEVKSSTMKQDEHDEKGLSGALYEHSDLKQGDLRKERKLKSESKIREFQNENIENGKTFLRKIQDYVQEIIEIAVEQIESDHSRSSNKLLKAERKGAKPMKPRDSYAIPTAVPTKHDNPYASKSTLNNAKTNKGIGSDRFGHNVKISRDTSVGIGSQNAVDDDGLDQLLELLGEGITSTSFSNRTVTVEPVYNRNIQFETIQDIDSDSE